MYDKEIAELRAVMSRGSSLNMLLNHNPDFKAVVLEGFLRDEILARSLNINADESGTLQFLKAAAVFNAYLKKVQAEADAAQVSLNEHLNLIQDAR